MGTEVRNIASDILSACVSSARAGNIHLTQPYRPTPKVIHGQLHAMLLMPPGGDKSTLIDEIPEKFKYEGEKFTGPGILGTIKKDGDFVPGAVTNAAGKCLIIDEFHSLAFEALKGLLKLTEQQKYKTTLGWNVAKPVKVSKKFIKYEARKNYMWIRSAKFSCLLAGIYAKKKSIDDLALSSRFMPVRFSMSIEEAAKMSLGKRYFSIKPRLYEGDFYFESYEKFVKIYLEIVKNLPQKLYQKYSSDSALLRRNLCHFSRLFAWASKGSSTITDWERYIPYMSITPYNAIASTLTLSEFEVYSLLKAEIKQNEIASMLDVSPPYVNKVVMKIRGLGLG